MARDRIEELLSIKQRAGKYRRVPHYSDLSTLRRLWEHNKNAGNGIEELIPVRIVTLIEVFLRHWIQVLVDHGAPYVERAAKLNANIKYDFAIARSLQGGSISLGELIGHSVSLSHLDTAAATLKTILDQDLFLALATVRDRWEERQRGEALAPIIGDIDEHRRVLARIFEVRNIVVHELPENPPHDAEEVIKFLDVAAEFLHAADEHFSTLIFGDYPLSQMEMNTEAASRHAAAMDELEGLCRSIEESSDTKELKDVQRAWLAFKEAEANRQTEWHHGGTIRPLIYHTTAARLTTDRIKQIKEAEENRMD
ncbi:lysozyme inhibitor LprI family protein [Bradyrhizobium sp. ORS 111]|uniref:lysozyme inhibitor LprI family protein n=1 Tax=Bradyrhizobium sp. ORS 111 TaxID=1685958 RepID=UPI00388D7AAD